MKKMFKKLTILFICCVIATSVYAKGTNKTETETTDAQAQEIQTETTEEPQEKQQQAIELDLSNINNKVNVPKNVNKGAYKSKNYAVKANDDNRYVYDERDAYQKKTTSYKKSKKFKNGEVGAKYDTTIAPESATQTRTLYTKYNLNSKTSVNASYKNGSSANPSDQLKGTVSVSPEYRINKKVSVQNDFSKNINSVATKEGVSIKINPLKDHDRMDIQMGAGQVQYQGGPPPSSQINFGTNFRF